MALGIEIREEEGKNRDLVQRILVIMAAIDNTLSYRLKKRKKLPFFSFSCLKSHEFWNSGNIMY